MIYYNENDVLIRDLVQDDAEKICAEEVAQGWNQTVDKYYIRLADQESKKAICLVAEYKGNVAGYINVYPKGPHGDSGRCEIIDFGVLEKCRCHGIGSKLMDVAEQVAGEYTDTVWLGVGLHSGYGSAQRMYCKRGYIPDGTGVWYGDKVAEPYQNYCNDDDLVLYFNKKLK